MRFFLLIVLMLSCSCLSSQGDALKRANEFFKEKNYRNALLELNNIPQTNTSGPLVFKRAICYYELNELDKALAGINSAENIGYKSDDLLYYKGRILHHKGNFIQSIESYKAYLESVSLDDTRKSEVRNHIRQAGAGLDILYIDPIATIENAGGNINSSQDDIRLIQSSGKENRYYFNSNRSTRNSKVSDYLNRSFELDAQSDINIYYIDKNDSEWTQSEKLENRNINTYKNDQLIDFSLNGESVYILRGKENESKSEYELVVQDGSLEMKRRIKDLSDMIGVVEHFHFFNDSTVVFSSNHLNGEGGYDLYVTAYANDSWLTPKNLGPQINTYADEVSPYLSNDGSVLFFSSNRSFSVGGMDVFRSQYLFEQEKWSEARNIGLPINSPGNEIEFRLSDDGLIATFTSDRKDGFGKNDLYFAYLNEKEDHQSYTVKNLGFVDYPDFYIDKIKEPIVVYESNPTTKTNELRTTKIKKPEERRASIQLPILTPNPEGEILYKENYEKLDRLASQMINASVEHLEIMSFAHEEGIAEYNLFLSIKTAEKIKDALIVRGVEKDKIHIKGYGDFLPLIKNNVNDRNIALLNNRIQFKVNMAEENLNWSEIPLSIDKSYLNKRFEIFRTLVDDAIAFKIQIATVRQMYRGTALKLYNDVQVEKDENTGNYLYSVGLYDSFLEANSVMRELSEFGITSLKIIPFVDGVRVQEADLVHFASDYPELKEYIRSMSFTEFEEEE